MFKIPKTEKISYTGTYVVHYIHATLGARMRDKFIKEEYTNIAINMSLVKTMSKRTVEVDKEVKLNAYTIRFNFYRDVDIWYFKTSEERDEEFDKLVDGRDTAASAWVEKDGKLINIEEITHVKLTHPIKHPDKEEEDKDG